jgi:D-alanyl-D-alanine carboxypeptidase
MNNKYNNQRKKKRNQQKHNKRILTPLLGFLIIIISSLFIHDLFLEKKSGLSYASQPPTNWQLILANPWNTLPENFTVETKSFSNGHSVDKRIFDDLEMMLDDARKEGLSPIICSSYRSLEKQKTLFENKIGKYLSNGLSNQEATVEAAKWIAVPGTSEHQTGLAVDIVAKSYQMLDKEQENTPEQKWLMENSYKYGFILRYPENKSDITGISYEPWHYRYVGKEAAKEIYENGICLEEYLEQSL